MPPVTIQGVGLEAKGELVLASFTLSESPRSAWIEFFRERSSGSLLGIGEAIFRRNRVQVELQHEEDLDALMRSVEAIVEGTNLDVEFRWPIGFP